MKLASLAVVLLLLGAAPPPIDVPVGRFMTWGMSPARPLRFISGGVEVTVAALPCPATPIGDGGCVDRGINNQASIVVRAPGSAPFRTESGDQASFVRVVVVRFDRRDRRLGVIVDNQSGGSAGLTEITAMVPTVAGYRAVKLNHATGKDGPFGMVEGEIADDPRDLSGDGRLDFVLRDGAFDSAFGCNACTPRPPLVLSVVDGRGVDLSASPAVRAVFARDLVAQRAGCRSRQDYHNGACAAYVADAARTGQFQAAWRDMLAHYGRGPRGGELWQGCTVAVADAGCPGMYRTHYQRFPESLRAFLVSAGYITPADATAVALS